MGGTFIIYDRKMPSMMDASIPERYLENMIKGYILVRCQDGFGRVKKISANNTKMKTLLFAMANDFCEKEDAKLYVEPSDMDIMGFEFGPQTYEAGYMSAPVLSGKMIDGMEMGRHEAQWRKSFDRYDQFKHLMHEMADSKD